MPRKKSSSKRRKQRDVKKIVALKESTKEKTNQKDDA